MEPPSHHSEVPHQPVLYKEIIHALEPQRGGFYVDCTLGAGGHAWGLLNASDPDGQLLGLDIDPQVNGWQNSVHASGLCVPHIPPCLSSY
jgi:16S rRNA C1402 N4-methylase RsmH